MFRISFILLLTIFAVGCSEKSVDSPPTPQDAPPRAVESFKAQSVTAERETLTISFSNTFSDPEGASLNYQATSSNVLILTVAVAGTSLTISPVAEGSATVTIKATDPVGNSATVTIPVTVNPSPAHPNDDEIYVRSYDLEVGLSSVRFLVWSAQGAGSCREVDPQHTFFDDELGVYQVQVHHSRWQTRDDFGWITIPGTERNDNRLCVYTPTEPGKYRFVVEFTRTSVATGNQTDLLRSSSNVLIH